MEMNNEHACPSARGETSHEPARIGSKTARIFDGSDRLGSKTARNLMARIWLGLILARIEFGSDRQKFKY